MKLVPSLLLHTQLKNIAQAIPSYTWYSASDCTEENKIFFFSLSLFNPHDIILPLCVRACRGQTGSGSFGCTSHGRSSVGRRSFRRSKWLWKRSAVCLGQRRGAFGSHRLIATRAFRPAEVRVAETDGHRRDVGHLHDEDQHAVSARRSEPGHVQGLADPHQLQDAETRVYQRQTLPVSVCRPIRSGDCYQEGFYPTCLFHCSSVTLSTQSLSVSTPVHSRHEASTKRF